MKVIQFAKIQKKWELFVLCTFFFEANFVIDFFVKKYCEFGEKYVSLRVIMNLCKS